MIEKQINVGFYKNEEKKQLHVKLDDDKTIKELIDDIKFKFINEGIIENPDELKLIFAGKLLENFNKEKVGSFYFDKEAPLHAYIVKKINQNTFDFNLSNSSVQTNEVTEKEESFSYIEHTGPIENNVVQEVSNIQLNKEIEKNNANDISIQNHPDLFKQDSLKSEEIYNTQMQTLKEYMINNCFLAQHYYSSSKERYLEKHEFNFFKKKQWVDSDFLDFAKVIVDDPYINPDEKEPLKEMLNKLIGLEKDVEQFNNNKDSSNDNFGFKGPS